MLLTVHIAAGGLAIVLGAVALSVKKGGTIHRRSGLLFVCAMVVMGTTASILEFLKSPSAGNVVAGLMTAYFVVTALTTVRPVSRWTRGIGVAALTVALALALHSIVGGVKIFNSPGRSYNGVPFFMPFFLATVLILAAAGDVRIMRSSMPRGGPRLARHLWRMCFALFIAAGSFFSVPARVAKVLPYPFTTGPMRALPILLLFGAMFFWLWRVRRGRTLPVLVRHDSMPLTTPASAVASSPDPHVMLTPPVKTRRVRDVMQLAAARPSWRAFAPISSTRAVDPGDNAAGGTLMRRSALIAVAVLSVARIAAGQPATPQSTLLGHLERGPHAVGFRLIDRIDHSRAYRMPRRPDGSVRVGEHGRPMRISVWYPAEANTAPRLSFGDYTALMGAEAVAGALTPEQARQGEEILFQLPVLRDLDAGQRKQLLALQGIALRDARPLPGRFPLVIWSLGSAALSHASCEYLASHGYVVAQMPRLGVFAGLPDTGRDAADLDAKLRDMDFVLNAVHELPFVDAERLGVVGFSAGGRWALGVAMKHPSVAAVVSLDTVMLFGDDGTRAWRTLPSFDLSQVRVPVLHMIRKEWVPREDKALWEGLRHADRWYMRFDAPPLDHLDFESIGYATTLVGGRPPHKTVVRDAFHAFNRYTLAFLDANVKGDAKARARFDRPPQSQGLPAGFVDVAFTAAEPGPMRLADFLGLLEENGIEAAIETYRTEWKRRGVPPVSEQGLNLAAYTFLFGRPRPDAAIQLFELNVAAFPQSANAHDSLADAYQAKGDAARARALAEKALALLEADAAMAPERKELIRQSVQQKLEPAPPPAN